MDWFWIGSNLRFISVFSPLVLTLLDPLVFGGPDFSVTRANEFDPTRPQAELDQILTFNGLFPEVDARRAPRGCLGVHLVMNLAAQYIGAILPDPLKANFSDAPATVIVCVRGATDNDSNRIENWFGDLLIRFLFSGIVRLSSVQL